MSFIVESCIRVSVPGSKYSGYNNLLEQFEKHEARNVHLEGTVMLKSKHSYSKRLFIYCFISVIMFWQTMSTFIFFFQCKDNRKSFSCKHTLLDQFYVFKCGKLHSIFSIVITRYSGYNYLLLYLKSTIVKHNSS